MMGFEGETITAAEMKLAWAHLSFKKVEVRSLQQLLQFLTSSSADCLHR
jgi:hypothetical protein